MRGRSVPVAAAVVMLAAVGNALAQGTDGPEAFVRSLIEAITLLREGRRVEAIRHYARESGEDLAMARAIVELLAPEAR